MLYLLVVNRRSHANSDKWHIELNRQPNGSVRVLFDRRLHSAFQVGANPSGYIELAARRSLRNASATIIAMPIKMDWNNVIVKAGELAHSRFPGTGYVD
jgi:hypothetical protein